MEFLHIDSGQGTSIVNVRGFEIFAHSHWNQNCGVIQPRGWIEVEVDDFYIVDEIALFLDQEAQERNQSAMITLKHAEDSQHNDSQLERREIQP
jgi:hypothetical protein